MRKVISSQEEKALAEARDELSRARAALSGLFARVREADNKARDLAGVDPVGCANACREQRAFAEGIGALRANVRQAEQKVARFEPAAQVRADRRSRPRQARNGHVDRSAQAKAATAQVMARLDYA